MKRIVVLIFIFITCLQAGNATIHSVGDSHAMCNFRGISECTWHHIGSITMHRVGRDGLKIVNLRTLGIQEKDVVIFVFGEIDVRCHIGKQRDQLKRSENEILDTLVQKYIATILENKKQYRALDCVICTILPPTDQCFNPAVPRYGSLEDRINLTKKLNQKLKDAAQKFGLKILDVYEDYATIDGALKSELSDGLVHIGINQTHFVRKKLHALLGITPQNSK